MLKWITKFTHKIENQAVKTGFVYRLACKYYQSVINKEVELANITKEDHILCIGGGICPFSAILFHQLTGAKVTVIDNNEKCVPKAKKVIERLGIGEKVRVLHQDGNSIKLTDYTVIHFALQVFPMEQVFLSVTKKARAGTKLLVRRPKKQLSALYNKLTDGLTDCCCCATHKARNIGSTLLYTKSCTA
jgi:D-arabinose 1-dehydrogenase-like Zn-dependent alcohol dehydrogenase